MCSAPAIADLLLEQALNRVELLLRDDGAVSAIISATAVDDLPDVDWVLEEIDERAAIEGQTANRLARLGSPAFGTYADPVQLIHQLVDRSKWSRAPEDV